MALCMWSNRSRIRSRIRSCPLVLVVLVGFATFACGNEDPEDLPSGESETLLADASGDPDAGTVEVSGPDDTTAPTDGAEADTVDVTRAAAASGSR